MKRKALLAVLISLTTVAQGQVIISDTYNGSGTGFALGSGVNTDINPPTTRLGGSAASGLSYIEVGAKTDSLYSISGNKLRVDGDANFGAVTLSADGSTALNFAPLLGTGSATSSNPITYDISISMANNFGTGGRARFSFAIGTDEPVNGSPGLSGAWDFGLQLYRNSNNGGGYTIGRRMDMLSGQGLDADSDFVITQNIGAGTFGTEIDFLIRVTDAGVESDSYNSRIQVSRDGGSTFIYDTDSDEAITGFRFDSTDRYLTLDVAGNAALGGYVTYDNLTVTVPEPSTIVMAGLGGAALLFRRRRMSSRK